MLVVVVGWELKVREGAVLQVLFGWVVMMVGVLLGWLLLMVGVLRWVLWEGFLELVGLVCGGWAQEVMLLLLLCLSRVECLTGDLCFLAMMLPADLTNWGLGLFAVSLLARRFARCVLLFPFLL